MFKIGVILLVILPAAAFSLQIRGKVMRADTRAGIASADIVLKSGTNTVAAVQTLDDGSFVLDAAAGRYTLSVMAPGYYQESRDITVKAGINVVFYIIAQSTSNLGEIEVTGEKLKDTESKNVITKDVREKAPENITGDPVHTITLMPGVSDLGMGNLQNNTKLSVRGGTGNENLALLDNALVEYPYHHFIGDSVFIDDIVDSIDLYKGVLPARYGQAESSLLQVNTIEGEPGFHGKVDLGLINTYITVSGATEDRKWNYAGGLRRTQYDLVMPLFLQGGGTNFHAPYYLDSHGRISYKDGGDTVSLDWLFSEEPMSWTNFSPSGTILTNADSLDYIDSMLNLDWQHSFSGEWALDQTLGVTWSYMDFEMNEKDNSTVMRESGYDLRYKTFATYAPLENLSFDIGGEVQYFPQLFYTNYILSFITNQVTGSPEWQLFNNSAWNGSLGIYSLFIENDTGLFDRRVFIEDGLRLNYVDYIKKYSFDPRLTLGYRFTPGDKVYICAGYLSEFPADGFSLEVLDTNKELSIPGCWHFIAGTGIEEGAYGLSLEGYYKYYVNYPSQESNVAYLMQTSGEEHRVYGADFLLMKKKDNIPVYGWLSIGSYYVRGYRTTGFDPNSLENLNPGPVMGQPSVMVSGQFSQPPVNEWFDPGSLLYKVDLVAIWDISGNWTLTSEFQWQSGGQYTSVAYVQTNTIGGNTFYTPVWNTYNAERLPDIHQLNLKIEYRGLLFELPAGIYLEVNNVYNYRPVLYYSYSDNYNTKTAVESPIGIYPELGVWMKW